MVNSVHEAHHLARWGACRRRHGFVHSVRVVYRRCRRSGRAEERGSTLCRHHGARHPYQGVQTGLEQLPWIVAAPQSAEVVGHLFYYDHRNAWLEERLSPLHMYSGGESPDGRLSMKILWEVRRGTAPPVLDVLATRIDGPGSSHQQLPSTSSDPSQFPSIIDIATPGCWRLTLKAGSTTGHVVVDVVRGK